MSELLIAALAYAARGWPVFPVHSVVAGRCSCGRADCASPGKHPRTINGFKGATTDDAQIKAWWERWPQANVAVPTGSKTFIAIDVDARAGGNESLADLVAKYGDVPTTIISETGGGGRHLLFAGKARNSASKLASGIDVRGDGGYIVVPPSSHASGRFYRWAAECSPDQSALADVPGWLLPAGNLAGLPIGSTAAIDRQAEDRCRAYLEKTPDAISGQGGHGNTLRAACECFRFGLTDSQAWSMLSWFNCAKCQPPWTERELRHKLSEGRKLVEREGKFGERLNDENSEWPIEPAAPIIELKPERPFVAQVSETPFPSDLLAPPGMVGKICQWINATAIKPQPILSMANALAFYGAVVGRKVRTTTDLRTNLYSLGVGDSGCGKDHSRKAIKRICTAANCVPNILGGEEVTSDSSIINSVHTKPSILFQFDEIGHMISQINSKYAASHQKNIVPTFMRLFSSASTIWLGKEFAKGERKDIECPNVCLYGTTVPTRLYEGLTPGDITDGFLGRVLVFQSHDPDPDSREIDDFSVPEEITANVAAWIKRADMPLDGTGNLAKYHPHVVTCSGEAAGAMARFAVECREAKAKTRGTGFDVLWSRADEHAAKLALIVAAGCDGGMTPSSGKSEWVFDAIEITGDIAAWAVRVIREITVRLIEVVRQSVAGSDSERWQQIVEKIIRDAGPRGISANRLTHRTRRLARKQKDEAIASLLQAGTIDSPPGQGKSGRPLTIYRFVSNEEPE